MTERPTSGDGEFASAHVNHEALADLAWAALSDQTAVTDLTDRDTTTAEAPSAGSSDAQAQHLNQCADCRRALDNTVRVLKALHSPVEIHQPPHGLWDRIAAEIDDAEIPDTAIRDTTIRHTAEDMTDDDAPVEALRPRNVANWRVPLAAAAAGALIGGAAVATVAINQEDSSQTDPTTAVTVIGEASLEPIAADEFSGTAEMVETDQGTLELTVEITSVPDEEDGYFELWLRDEDATRLFSLGAVKPGSTTFDVPSGVDLTAYPVVDVSHEHFDGDPAHSGITLAAGTMERDD